LVLADPDIALQRRRNTERARRFGSRLFVA
jgi:hypothetical protein